MSTRNSSPPMRATVSPPRTDAREPLGGGDSTSSPAPWPMVSLTRLKRSRSTKSSPTIPPRRPTRLSACSSRSSSSARLGRPVSSSCRARRRISSDTCDRSMAVARTLASACRNASSSWGNARGSSASTPMKPIGPVAAPDAALHAGVGVEPLGPHRVVDRIAPAEVRPRSRRRRRPPRGSAGRRSAAPPARWAPRGCGSPARRRR